MDWAIAGMALNVQTFGDQTASDEGAGAVFGFGFGVNRPDEGIGKAHADRLANLNAGETRLHGLHGIRSVRM